MAEIKVFMVKQEKVESVALPPDILNAVKENNCVQPPEIGAALSAFANQNSYHQRCLTVKANCVAGLGYSFMNVDAAKRIVTLLDNQTLTFNEILTRFWYDYELFGRAYLEISRIGTDIRAIHHMPARDIYIRKDRQRYWQMLPSLEKQEFAALKAKDRGNLHEIIELIEYTPESGYYGLPKYLGALPAMTINTLISTFNLTFFSNNAMPDLAIIIEGGELDEKAEGEIRTFLTDNIKGVLNSHKTVYIPVSDPNVKVRIEKLNDVKDGQFRFLRQDNRDEIISAMVFRPGFSVLWRPALSVDPARANRR